MPNFDNVTNHLSYVNPMKHVRCLSYPYITLIRWEECDWLTGMWLYWLDFPCSSWICNEILFAAVTSGQSFTTVAPPNLHANVWVYPQLTQESKMLFKPRWHTLLIPLSHFWGLLNSGFTTSALYSFWIIQLQSMGMHFCSPFVWLSIWHT